MNVSNTSPLSIQHDVNLDGGASKSNLNKIKESLKSLASAINRWGITLTAPLPFSGRGIVINIIFLPLRLVQSFGSGFAAIVQNKSIKVFASVASQALSESLKKDWEGGISDWYIDLNSPDNKAEALRVTENYLRYAAYMYAGVFAGNLQADLVIDKHSINWSGTLIDDKYLNQVNDEKVKKTLQTIICEIKKLGFEEDGSGNYFDRTTGSIFNIIYDEGKKEVVIGFMGLGNHDHLTLSKEDKNAVALQSRKAAGADWFGGIPTSARQAIEIGKILKKVTSDTELTPVIIGHSHGGGLAQCAAAANGLKGVVFNSRPMGASMRRYIGQDTIEKNAKNIVAFSGEGDFLSRTRIVNMLAIIFERVTGIPVPRTVGVGYNLPRANTEENQHVSFLRQFLVLVEKLNLVEL